MASSAAQQAYKLAVLKAASEDDASVMRRFIDDANLNWEDVRNKECQNVVHVASMAGSESVVSLLLSYPKVTRSLHLRDKAGRNALHLATAMGYHGVVERLVGSRAALNVQDNDGSTALHHAVKFEWVGCLRVLLDAAADPLREDGQGRNALDIAHKKQDDEALKLLARFEGARRPSGLRRFLPWLGGAETPQRRLGTPTMTPGSGGSANLSPVEASVLGRPSPGGGDRGAGVGSMPGGAHGPERTQLVSAMEEACGGAGAAANDDTVIEWDGLQPRLVNSGSGTRQPPADRFGAASAAGRQRSSSVSRGQCEAAGATGGKKGAAEAPAKAASSGRTSGNRGAAPFRMAFFFDERVQRLEFEVEWLDRHPAAGNVKPGGEAERRGMHRGDTIVAIGNHATAGKGRDALLPALKERPLMLHAERVVQVAHNGDPFTEVKLSLSANQYKEHGLTLERRGRFWAASNVRPKSRAWAAGVLPGDALVRVDGRGADQLEAAALSAEVGGQAQSLTVWRRPMDADIAAPWRGQ